MLIYYIDSPNIYYVESWYVDKYLKWKSVLGNCSMMFVLLITYLVQKCLKPSKTIGVSFIQTLMGGGFYQQPSFPSAALIARNAFFEKMTDDDVTGLEFMGDWKLDYIPSPETNSKFAPWKVTETLQKRRCVESLPSRNFCQGLLLLNFGGVIHGFCLMNFQFGRLVKYHSVARQQLGGGFKDFWNFHPKIGEDSHFDSYFSNGLKPPTRQALEVSDLVNSQPCSHACWLQSDHVFHEIAGFLFFYLSLRTKRVWKKTWDHKPPLTQSKTWSHVVESSSHPTPQGGAVA